MSEAMKKAIEEMQTILATKEAEVASLMQTINVMARAIGESAPYPDDPKAATPSASGSSGEVSPDEFFGRSPITAAREYLEKVGKPRTADQILTALTKGGFDFAAQNWKEEKLRLKNLAISLSKNTNIFVRLPSGPFGLVKWYPELKRKKNGAAESAAKTNARSAQVLEADEEGDDDIDEAEQHEDSAQADVTEDESSDQE